MTLTLYGLKNCDKCRKARKDLDAAGRQVRFVDIREEADLRSRVPAWLESAGADALVNKRSTTWRNLPETERARAEGHDGAAALLIANPTLIKRPVIEAGGAVHIGWDKAVRLAFGV